MVGAGSNAEVTRRRLTVLLKRLQAEKQLSVTAAGEAAGRGQSYWSKVMNGTVLPKREQIETFLNAIGYVDPDIRGEILRLADDLHRVGSTATVVVAPAHSRSWQRTLNMEARAAQVFVMASQSLPDLLRTHAVHRHVVRALSVAQQRASLDELVERQVRLGHPQHEYVFLLCESTILRLAGLPAQMEWEQLQHLADLVKVKTSIGMIPLSADVPAEPISYRVIDMARAVAEVPQKGHVVLRDQVSIDFFNCHFRAMRRAAVTGREFLDYLCRRAARLGAEACE
ncbi:helix-turn-helix domain-containing protein [Lentzea alba]|uniref:Scr1 family TA system antitoxin-like transcriptional regulator n=1 Tax=Lentzea alba TaxID=2714351 RepID=UPI0039BFAF95